MMNTGNNFHKKFDDKTKTPPPPKPNARRLALLAFSDVIRGKGYSTLSLGELLRESKLPIEEKRLATNIFYTTLENLYRIDYILSRFLERKPEPVVEDIMRISVAQMLLMDRIPDHAVVDEAVKLVKRYHMDHAAGMVNAILRNIIRRRDEDGIIYPKYEDDPIEYLSVMYSINKDVVSALIADYGKENAEKIITYKPTDRYDTVRPNMLRMNNEEFEQFATRKNWKYAKGIVPGALRLTNPGDLAGDKDYKDGYFSMQNEAAMLAAMAVRAKTGETILDACAAPGGKTAYICESMALTGRVFAWDLHEHRVELIQSLRKRLKLDSLRAVIRDASIHYPEQEMAFDAVLIDAPCSGFGVMQDKPDIRLRTTMEDVKSLVQTQQKILEACASYPVIGGRLVYSTCTIMKDENERQIELFLQKHPEYERDTDDSWLPAELKPLFANGEVQFQAYRDQIEGFYIACLRKKA